MENQNSEIAQVQITPELLGKRDAYWRAANYLSVGQIYLRDNPLMRKPLKPEHIKPMLLGHRGTTPGQNFIYVHLKRIIKKYELNMIYVSGPGHGGPALVGSRLSTTITFEKMGWICPRSETGNGKIKRLNQAL
tara:strand:- start:183 stop:584 length:402 start_codon:yes stop_codon:yes gene_type:complete